MHQITEYYSIYDKDKKIIRCELCPHNCLILEGQRGICNTRKNVDGQFYSLVYGKPCSTQIDPIEKKPLYHFYPGEKVFSLGTFGCNLKCRGCQNYDISQINVEKNVEMLEIYSPEEIIKIAEESGCKMIAYTYNEPTIFFEYMIEIAKLAHKKGIKNIIVSNGYINPKPLKELLKYIDAANIDLKSFDEKFYKEYSGAKLEPVLQTIKTINESKIWLELTNLVIPTLNDNLKNIKEMCGWIKSINPKIPLHFSRFYPYHNAREIDITSEELVLKAKEIALKEGLKYVYIGNLGYQENTHCKSGHLLIEREIRKNNLHSKGIKDNRCKKCNEEIDGIFR